MAVAGGAEAVVPGMGLGRAVSAAAGAALVAAAAQCTAPSGAGSTGQDEIAVAPSPFGVLAGGLLAETSGEQALAVLIVVGQEKRDGDTAPDAARNHSRYPTHTFSRFRSVCPREAAEKRTKGRRGLLLIGKMDAGRKGRLVQRMRC